MRWFSLPLVLCTPHQVRVDFHNHTMKKNSTFKRSLDTLLSLVRVFDLNFEKLLDVDG